jgi:organic radical activating enzyme
MLPLVEDFYTLQGEGFHTGRAAYFIRLGGCDVGCRWCDAKDTWNPRVHPPVAVTEIVDRALRHPARAVVVTGGEPLMYPLDELCEELHMAGIAIFLETSGSHPFSGSFDWVCLSPKNQQPPLDEAWARADELKVIIEGEGDLDWAEECATKVSEDCRLFLQPEWSRRDAVMPGIVEYIKNHPRWRISLQAHKYMRIP